MINEPMTDREKALVEKIFNPYDEPILKCDCETCPYEKECEQNNPDFDANACLVD